MYKWVIFSIKILRFTYEDNMIEQYHQFEEHGYNPDEIYFYNFWKFYFDDGNMDMMI